MVEILHLTNKVSSRKEILDQVIAKRMTQIKAASSLDLSERQIRRLLRAYIKEGVTGLLSKKKGKASNRRMPSALRQKVIDAINNEDYVGFGPTFLQEILVSNHQINLSIETIRKLMIEEGTWKPKLKRRIKVHQIRSRRPRFGELVQIDGSPEAWFEERGSRCSLLVFIDDATNTLYAEFAESETTTAYFKAMRQYITLYGRPMEIYVDRHSVFRANKSTDTERRPTQFGRAMNELGIDIIYARTPQAKGRVERANRTLQDRLIKSMRLAGISTIEEGNEFLKECLPEFNQRFSLSAETREDAHCSLLLEHDLDQILCQKHKRILSKNLEFQYNNEIYQVVTDRPSYALRKRKVVITDHPIHGITVSCNRKQLRVRLAGKTPPEVGTRRELDIIHHNSRKPSPDHPWKREGRACIRRKKFML